MKTTVEISDALLHEARKVAARKGVTLRALIEQGLRGVVVSDKKHEEPFKLRRASFKGKGLRPEFRGASWEKLRDAVYEGRGG